MVKGVSVGKGVREGMYGAFARAIVCTLAKAGAKA